MLNKLQIPHKVDLPSVGENLQEHIFVGLAWELKDDASYDTLDLLRDDVQFLKTRYQLDVKGRAEGRLVLRFVLLSLSR